MKMVYMVLKVRVVKMDETRIIHMLPTGNSLQIQWYIYIKRKRWENPIHLNN
jgi:hypothetical protein